MTSGDEASVTEQSLIGPPFNVPVSNPGNSDEAWSRRGSQRQVRTQRRGGVVRLSLRRSRHRPPGEIARPDPPWLDGEQEKFTIAT